MSATGYKDRDRSFKTTLSCLSDLVSQTKVMIFGITRMDKSVTNTRIS